MLNVIIKTYSNTLMQHDITIYHATNLFFIGIKRYLRFDVKIKETSYFIYPV